MSKLTSSLTTTFTYSSLNKMFSSLPLNKMASLTCYDAIIVVQMFNNNIKLENIKTHFKKLVKSFNIWIGTRQRCPFSQTLSDI